MPNSFYKALRAHAMGWLDQMSDEELRAAQTALNAAIAVKERTLTGNLFRPEKQELRADLQWFTAVRDQIGTCLTSRFHGK